MNSHCCYTHTRNTFFYHPFGLFAFLSQQYFLSLLQKRLFSKESSMSLSWIRMDWRQDGIKELFVPKLKEKKKEEKMIQNYLVTLLIFTKTKTENFTRYTLTWTVFVHVLLSCYRYISQVLQVFKHNFPPLTHAYFLYYHLKSTAEFISFQEHNWGYHF